mgnify:CR=1 FL=1
MPTAAKSSGARKTAVPKKSSGPSRTRRASNVAYIFFNCDAEKSRESMNIFYNHEIYRDTQASRKALWQKIKAEQDGKDVTIIAHAERREPPSPHVVNMGERRQSVAG